jgi:hypothetical protein
VASFTSDARSGGTPLKVQFIDQSSGNPTSWRWTFQGGTPSSSTQQHPQITYNTTGTYAVTLAATNSAGSNEVIKQGYITITATGTEFVEQPQVAVYPNPATTHVWVTGATGLQPQLLKLYDFMGRVMPATCTAENDKLRIDVSTLQPGIYLLHIVLPDGATTTQKIIKN